MEEESQRAPYRESRRERGEKGTTGAPARLPAARVGPSALLCGSCLPSRPSLHGRR